MSTTPEPTLREVQRWMAAHIAGPATESAHINAVIAAPPRGDAAERLPGLRRRLPGAH
jgi:hypothetical protein